ncbi:hypothetical protein FQN57_002244 [Myotisia sp. PD_48]|nr:hypothetical protein FQN57_002244 [Myotisia sp. PD_48]
MGRLTQTEDKTHSFPGPLDDSSRTTLGRHMQMQPGRPTNKGAAFLHDTGSPFNAGVSLMKGSDPHAHHWGGNLSPVHSGSALSPGYSHTFDPQDRFLNTESFAIDSGEVFHNLKGAAVDRFSQSTPSAWIGHVYKYDLPSAAKQPRDHKSGGPTTPTRKEHPSLGLSRSPLSSCSHPRVDKMVYQEHWFPRLNNYGLQEVVHSPTRSALAASPFHPTPGRRESLAHLTAVAKEPDRSPLDTTTLSTAQYPANLASRQIHSPSISTPCDGSRACQQYSSHCVAVTLSTDPPPPLQRTIGSQPCEDSSLNLNSWHTDPIHASIFHYSQPTIEPQESGPWWAATSQPMQNRNLQQSLPTESYSAMAMAAPVPIRNHHHHQIDHTPDTLPNSGLMIQLGASSPELSSESPLSVAPLACSEETILNTPYTSLPYISTPQPQQLHASSLKNPFPVFPTPHSASNIPTISQEAPAPATTRRTTQGSSNNPRSPKPRQHVAPAQRRGNHSRKAASFSGQSTSKYSKSNSACNDSSSTGHKIHHSISNNSNIHQNNNMNAKAPISVSFVNFTPQDSHKLLTGVAPSGSSKTKARRELEAREKRRKLSEAALMAVRRAGGDVEALEAVFC